MNPRMETNGGSECTDGADEPNEALKEVLLQHRLPGLDWLQQNKDFPVLDTTDNLVKIFKKQERGGGGGGDDEFSDEAYVLTDPDMFATVEDYVNLWAREKWTVTDVLSQLCGKNYKKYNNDAEYPGLCRILAGIIFRHVSKQLDDRAGQVFPSTKEKTVVIIHTLSTVFFYPWVPEFYESLSSKTSEQHNEGTDLLLDKGYVKRWVRLETDEYDISVVFKKGQDIIGFFHPFQIVLAESTFQKSRSALMTMTKQILLYIKSNEVDSFGSRFHGERLRDTISGVMVGQMVVELDWPDSQEYERAYRRRCQEVAGLLYRTTERPRSDFTCGNAMAEEEGHTEAATATTKSKSTPSMSSSLDCPLLPADATRHGHKDAPQNKFGKDDDKEAKEQEDDDEGSFGDDDGSYEEEGEGPSGKAGCFAPPLSPINGDRGVDGTDRPDCHHNNTEEKEMQLTEEGEKRMELEHARDACIAESAAGEAYEAASPDMPKPPGENDSDTDRSHCRHNNNTINNNNKEEEFEEGHLRRAEVGANESRQARDYGTYDKAKGCGEDEGNDDGGGDDNDGDREEDENEYGDDDEGEEEDGDDEPGEGDDDDDDCNVAGKRTPHNFPILHAESADEKDNKLEIFEPRHTAAGQSLTDRSRLTARKSSYHSKGGATKNVKNPVFGPDRHHEVDRHQKREEVITSRRDRKRKAATTRNTTKSSQLQGRQGQASSSGQQRNIPHKHCSRSAVPEKEGGDGDARPLKTSLTTAEAASRTEDTHRAETDVVSPHISTIMDLAVQRGMNGVRFMDRKDVEKMGITAMPSTENACVSHALETIITSIMQARGLQTIPEQNSERIFGILDIGEYLENSLYHSDRDCPSVLGSEIEKVLKKILGKIGFNAELQDNNSKIELLTHEEGQFLVICEFPEVPDGHCLSYLVQSKASEKRRLLINNFPNQDSVEILDAGISSLMTDFDGLVSSKRNREARQRMASEIFRNAVGVKAVKLRRWFKITMATEEAV